MAVALHRHESTPDLGDGSGPRLLYVDLDLTLLKTDLLYEGAFRLIGASPLALRDLLVWASRGRAHLKRMVARSAELSVDGLPARDAVLRYIERRRAQGATVVLATAADALVAQRVASRFGCFDRVLANDGAINGKGDAKLAAILADAGGEPFEYLGDHRSDAPIWRAAQLASVVDRSARITRCAMRANPACRIVDRAPASWRESLRLLRLHQWAKNLLVFVPLLPVWPALGGEQLLAAAVAFVAFGLCASAAYVINDLLDLEADRRHPRKRNRPFASGAVPITRGPPLAALLLAGAFVAAAALGEDFVAALAAYLALTLAYSLELKRRMLLDVVALAMLYTLRIIAGAAAVAIEPSFWLLTCSMFVFYSLALVKRYVELADLPSDGLRTLQRRGYRRSDEAFVLPMGIASSMAAVVVFALYLNDPEVRARLGNEQLLWLLCPLMLYWLSRLWLKAVRHELHDDPLVFALTDRKSLLIVAAAAAALLAAPLG